MIETLSHWEKNRKSASMHAKRGPATPADRTPTPKELPWRQTYVEAEDGAVGKLAFATLAILVCAAP